MTTNELINLFFSELKGFNSRNFKTLRTADLKNNGDDPLVRKAFSSVLTRFNIFCEKHPEIDPVSTKIIYFKLGLDKIGKYFSDFPETTPDNFVTFQLELKRYVKSLEESGTNIENEEQVVSA
jgi:hypothetical protein